jgi:hypothetical protein
MVRSPAEWRALYSEYIRETLYKTRSNGGACATNRAYLTLNNCYVNECNFSLRVDNVRLCDAIAELKHDSVYLQMCTESGMTEKQSISQIFHCTAIQWATICVWRRQVS